MTNQTAINELVNTDDNYRVIGISTAHLSENDLALLEELVLIEQRNDALDGMPFAFVGKRNEGYLLKMYESFDLENIKITLPQDSLYTIAQSALNAGYRMIEFDCDANVYDCFPCYQ